MNEHSFPVAASVTEKIASSRIGDFSDASADCVLKRIRDSLRFPDKPHLDDLAESICARNLVCLTEYEGDFFFTLEGADEFPLSLPVSVVTPDENWPFAATENAPDFRDFIIHFGGMIDSRFPPTAYVQKPEWSVKVEQEEEETCVEFQWGNVEEWNGAHSFFQSSCGDLLVIRPKGQVGRWCHEIGWTDDEECAVVPMDSFGDLLARYSESLRLSLDDRQEQYCPWL